MERVIEGSILEPVWDPKSEYWNVPLMRDGEIIEQPADQSTITRRYTEEALQFIRANKDGPFFLYLAHTAPHVPLFRSEAFADVSERGLYGDVVEEIDWSAGQVLDTLREEGLAGNTLVFFTSDNGPWLPLGEQGGSAGLLTGGKSMTWDGGVREPAIAWWPGTVPAGRVESTVATTMDLFSTSLALADVDAPADRIVDGRNILPLLKGEAHDLSNDAHFFYHRTRIHAVRKGPWKAHFITDWAYASPSQYAEHDPPLLFNLEHDPAEQYDLAAANPDVIGEIRAIVAEHRRNLVMRPDQLAARESTEFQAESGPEVVPTR
jgi:arylsulfatase A-like enzyme